MKIIKINCKGAEGVGGVRPDASLAPALIPKNPLALAMGSMSKVKNG